MCWLFDTGTLRGDKFLQISRIGALDELCPLGELINLLHLPAPTRRLSGYGLVIDVGGLTEPQ